MRCRPWLPAGSLSVLLFALTFRCAPLSGDGNGSNVGNARGILYNADGTRARFAKVQAVPADFRPGPSGGVGKIGSPTEIVSTYTDDTGGYVFDSLPENIYNILGSGGFDAGDTQRTYIDSVASDGKTEVAIPQDTLRAPGTLHGMARLQQGDDNTKVLVLVMGTSSWTAPEDTSGSFRLSALARGRYHVRLMPMLPNYESLDTTLSVKEGQDLPLSNPLRLKYTGIPTPAGLAVLYDTLMQKVALRWNTSSADFELWYNVYRKNLDSNSARIIINASPIADTIFTDTSAAQDMTYEYSVVAVNTNNEEGAKSRPVSVTITGLFSIADSIIAPPEQFGFLASIAIDRGGNRYVADTRYKRLQKFTPNGAIAVLTNTLSSPSDLFMAEDGRLFVTEYSLKQIISFDSAGTPAAPVLTTKGRPFAYCETGGKRYVVSNSGLEIYRAPNTPDTTIPFEYNPLDSYNSGDIVIHPSGKAFLFYDNDLYRFDTANMGATRLFSIADNFTAQNAKLAIIQSDYIILHTVDCSIDCFSSLRVLSQSGEIKARWHTNNIITGLCADKSGSIIAATYDGKILTLRQNCRIK
jgi:hypothetical protein